MKQFTLLQSCQSFIFNLVSESYLIRIPQSMILA